VRLVINDSGALFCVRWRPLANNNEIIDEYDNRIMATYAYAGGEKTSLVPHHFVSFSVLNEFTGCVN